MSGRIFRFLCWFTAATAPISALFRIAMDDWSGAWAFVCAGILYAGWALESRREDRARKAGVEVIEVKP